MSRIDQRHRDNMKKWNLSSERWFARGVSSRSSAVAKDPEKAFNPGEFTVFSQWKRGKSACILGSGDNLLSIALTKLGYRVTSVDISENQLQNAERISTRLGLGIEYIQADIAEAGILRGRRFDFIGSTGTVLIWLADLNPYFANVSRLLNPKGLYLSNETHPFERVLTRKDGRACVDRDYFRAEHRPCTINPENGKGVRWVRSRPRGKSIQHLHSWRICDIVNALSMNGLYAYQMVESRRRSKLPFLSIFGKKLRQGQRRLR